MGKWHLNHKFYKTIDFWVGMFLVITNVYGIVPQGNVSLGFFLDLILFIVGTVIVINSLLRKTPKDYKR